PAQLNPTTAIQAWATVTDAPISLQAMTISGNSGQQLNNVLLATFTDPNVNETSGEYIAWVNWGDSVVGGQMLPPGSVSGNNGNFQVRGNSHTYAHGGTYKTVITIFDGSKPEPSEVQAVDTATLYPAYPTSGRF